MEELDISTMDIRQVAAYLRSLKRYRIVRNYFHGGKRTIRDRVTLAEAQSYCSDPETSSSTATSAKAKAITRRNGPWFDGYEER